MELIKRSERMRNSGTAIINCIKNTGGTIKHIRNYYKWIEVNMGSLRARLGLFKATLSDGKTGWFLIDALNQMACPIIPDEAEVLSFLSDEGWKVETEVNDDDEESEEDE